jgi:hypothetical protein
MGVSPIGFEGYIERIGTHPRRVDAELSKKLRRRFTKKLTIGDFEYIVEVYHMLSITIRRSADKSSGENYLKDWGCATTARS